MIKRYFATKDNTITNAFNDTLSTRGTGSNMGQSDILEVFSLYGQSSSSSGLSSEKARTIIEFDTSQILADKNSGAIASGSSFYLKLFNAKHSQTLPRNYTLEVSNVAESWEEGLGLDMENYTDLTYDTRGSNWIKRLGGNVREVTKFTFESDTATDYGAGAGAKWVKLYTAESTYGAFWFNDGAGDSAPGEELPIEIDISGLSSKATIATAFKNAVDANANFSANAIDNAVYVTASEAGSPQETVSKQGTWGANILTPEVWHAGDGSWRVTGSTTGSFLASAAFPVGSEDLEVDITSLVNTWLDGSRENNGMVIKVSSSLEDSGRSYYTKKFFARSSHNWFEKPVIEARWDSSILDDRGQFYLSSSLVSAEDNMNTVYLYNYVRGRLRNIPSLIYPNAIKLSLYADSNGSPTGAPLKLVADGTHVKSGNQYVVTGGLVSTGIYSASFSYTGSADISTVHDVWFSGSKPHASAEDSAVQFKTGSISVKRFEANNYTETSKYILSVSNRSNEYQQNQTHRIRLYARQKNWSPNIYNVATSVPDSLVFPSASYQIYRIMDDKVVIPYNTGSNQATRLSYDVSGNYFDLNTSMFEPNYTYAFKVSIYDPDTLTYEEQPFVYKFRVVKNEY